MLRIPPRPRGEGPCRAGPRGAALLLVLSALGFDSVAHTQVADPTFPATDGVVYALAIRGDTLYLGGSFHAAGGVMTGGFAALDAQSGAPRRVWPRVAGRVYATASDGKGGWYFGGFFTSIAGVGRNGLAHIRADGSLDAWNPSVHGQVYALAIACSTVYVGGSFDSIGGQPRACFGAVDAASGAVLPINPGIGLGNVQAIAVRDSTVYVGGAFSYFGGQGRDALAAIHARTGATLPWNPRAGPLSSYPNVQTLAIQGTTVYAGGAFTLMGGQPHRYLAAVDAVTGAVLPWAPDPNSVPYSLAAGDSVLYAAGAFTSIAGQTRGRGAAFSISTGELLPWDPAANDRITCLFVTGPCIYAGGSFTLAGNDPHQFLAALDPVSGAALPWVASPDAAPSTLGADASAVYVGGNYTTVGMQPRSNLAAIDCATGEVLPWDPGANAAVFALLAQDSTVYAGGTFGYMGGLPRSGLAAVDAATGEVRAWTADANASVHALAVSRSSLYVGGEFTSLGGQTRNHLGAVDVATGTLLGWNPGPDGSVLAMAATHTALYVAGAFANIATQPRYRLASFSTANGALRSWNPSASGTAATLCLALGKVYVGGEFSSMGPHVVRRMCAVDTASGLVQEWQNVGTDDRVNALAVSDGLLFAGGDFIVIGNEMRSYLGALDATTGLMQPWLFNASDPVCALATHDSTLYIGGAFVSLGGMPKHGLARIPGPFGYAPLQAQLLSPAGGAELARGATVRLLWSASGGTADVQSVDLYLSRNGPGGPWDLIAAGIVNTDAYDWTVTGPETEEAFLRLDARDFVGAFATAYAGPFCILGSSTPTLIERFTAARTAAGIRIEWELGQSSAFTAIRLERGESADGPFAALTPELAPIPGVVVVVDSSAAPQLNWWYRLSGRLRNGGWFVGSPIPSGPGIPCAFALSAPSPNPCTREATCVLDIPRTAHVRLSAFDVQGREVALLAEGTYPAGSRRVALDASRMEPGLYFVRLQSPGIEVVRRLVRLR